MKTNITIGIGLLLVLLHFSCNEIFEEDLTDKEIYTISPPDGYISQYQDITFWWDYVAGADSYQIQIVSPSFDYIEVIEYDTLIAENKFTGFFYYPGEYEWSVRALNSASETFFSYPQRFYIDSAIASGVIEMLLPMDNQAIQGFPIVFAWNDENNTNEYLLRICKDDTVILSKTVYEQKFTLDSTNQSFSLEDGEYTWKVQSISDNQLSGELKSQFYIDNTAPAYVGVIAPANEDTLPSPIEFKWKELLESGTPVTYHLVVSSDSLFTKSEEYSIKEGLSYELDLNPNSYFWKIYASDEAGNTGTSDGYYKIVVIEEPEDESQDE